MKPATETAPTTKDVIYRGEMEKLISEFDWSKTAIGPRNAWSESLKNLVNMMLANRFPMLLWWGEQYIQLYNDPYIPMLGLKHPSPGLGHPGHECWEEIWSVIAPLVDTPFKGGPATWMDDIPLKLNRNNFVEETHFTIAYSPAPDPSAVNGIGGVLATVIEITGEIISKRQMELLRKLGKGLSSTSSVTEVYTQTAKVLRENNFDIPFAFIHRIDSGSKAYLETVTGIPINHRELPAEIDLTNENSAWRNLIWSAKEGTLVVAENDQIKSQIPCGAWDTPPTRFVHLPIREANRGTPIAIVTLALSPLRQFDESYSNFVQLIADQITSGVTNAMAYEKEKQRAEALAELDKAKTDFFSNVSHEFRTPLTLMLGPLDDLLGQKQDKVTTDREIISLIHRNGLRLQKLVNTLLDFSGIEAGRMKMLFKPTDFSKITCNIASNFTSAMAKAGLTYEINCPTLPEPIYLDEEMWEKIVLNLLSNAFKFTFEGKITVQISMLADAAELKISDTGIGISEEDQKHIFDRFHRVYQARSRSFEGSGIGLALVNELIKLHGGTIKVESTPGKGTTFIVHIPRGKAHLPTEQVQSDTDNDLSTAIKANVFVEEALRWFPDAAKEYASTTTTIQEQAIPKPTIILADDNADMREYIKSILSEYCHVHAVVNGKEAYDLAKEIKPDLILSDIMMAELDGFELVKLMRHDPSLKTTPIILLSARAGEEATVEGFQAGANDYLTKPFTRKELIARVNSNIQLANIRKIHETELERRVENRTRELNDANSALKISNNDLQQFAHVASHDLKEPVRKIKTFTYRLMDDTKIVLSEKNRLWLKKILSSAERMSEMIDGVLRYSSLNGSYFEPEKVNLNAIIEDIKTDLELLIQQKGATITYSNLPTVIGMQVLLYQLFYNLISNSLKFSHPDRHAVIDINWQVIERNKTKNHVITVKDNGIGFEQEFRELIFETFSRLNGKDQFEGTGLGLALCRKIVERHHGTIRAEGQKDQGATFIIEIPVDVLKLLNA